MAGPRLPVCSAEESEGSRADRVSVTIHLLHLVQAWANYGPGAQSSRQSILIRPAEFKEVYIDKSANNTVFSAL